MTAARGEAHPLGPDRDGAPVVQVPLQRLRFHPRNIRRNLGDLRGLAASIRAEGILVPLMAERRLGGGLRLLHGHRRWAAADMIGLSRVPCQVVPQHTEDEAILVMLAENTGRAAVEPDDLCTAVRALVDEFGWSASAVAQRLGVPIAVVEDWGAGRTTRPQTLARRVPDRVAPAAGRTPRPWRPVIRPAAVHDLITRFDADQLDPAALVDELRGWLAGWAPKPKPDPKPAEEAS